MKRHSIFFLCLLLVVGIVSMLGIPTDAYAAIVIDTIEVWVNPDMVATTSEDNTPNTISTDLGYGANPASGQIVGAANAARLPKFVASTGFANGTLSGGTKVTAANASSTTAVFGDTIAIVINMSESSSNLDWHFGSILIPGYDGWAGGTRTLYASRALAAPSAPLYNLNLSDASLVYAFTVRADDYDTDGGWFTFANGASPFRVDANTAPPDGGFDPAAIHYPIVDGGAPNLAAAAEFPVKFVGAPTHTGPSRYYQVRQECLQYHGLFGDAYTTACTLVHTHGWALADEVNLDNSPQAAFYGLGDTIAIQVTFSKSVIADAGVTLKVQPPFGGSETLFELTDADRTDGDKTLTFRYTVKAGDRKFSSIDIEDQNLRHNTRASRNSEDFILNPKHIRGQGGISFDSDLRFTHDFETPLRAFLINEPMLSSWEDASYKYGDSDAYADEYALAVIKHLVDAVPPTVWIAGLIKNGETHTEDRRNAIVNLDPSASGFPVTDFAAEITESVSQSGAFDVEFRFTNHYKSDGALAEEIGTTFGAEDIVLTDAAGNSLDWTVAAPVYIGLDHRAAQNYGDTTPPDGHAPGDAKGSASFLVYKATITPPFGFVGDVTIALPAGATMDIAGNASLASNTLTVPVDNPLRVVEPPEIVEPPAGVYTAGDKIEVSVTYAQENLRYEGANPPYLVVYLGEQVLANARHAVWTAAAATNSTTVTFAYTVAATDTVTDAVRAPSVEILVPEETTLLSGPLGAPDGQQVGTAAPAVASGAAPASVPVLAPVENTSGREVAPVVRKTPVIPVVPFFPEAASPKAAASAVPRSPIVFNELGNGSGAANDWLELRNVTGSEVSLKDYELSVVADGQKEDTSLVVFADVSVPAHGLLLITNSAPDKTPLAGGEQRGLSHAFLVDAGLSLPDDGKFLLILRNAKEKLGMNEAFVDVAGGGGSDTDAFVREQTGDYDTYVWPLQVLQAPGGDTEGALGSGKVWQRAKADIVGYHKDAWAEAAFTGIGYDRNVSQSAATGGTPGYPNGAVKTAAATPKGSITISEVMFDSGGGTLPQWIELYNKSKTEALNLNRWQLEFQNVDSEELVGRPIVALTLQEKVIQPNQTLLIVAGPARASSSTAFPAERVYNLLDLHQRNLRIKTARDTFLSAEGFYLKLTDSNGNLVDEVGNTDGNRRTKDAPAWALPVSGEEGVRSSLIRRYDKGVALKGKERASWALASNVKRLAVSDLHYGHAEDIGTPGYRAGGALPVELSSFTVARTEAGAVVVTWTTESEVDNAGFNLRRSEKRDSGFTLLNAALIAGAGTTGERQTYTFTDTSAKPGVEYYYQIEEVAFDGRPVTLATRMLRGPVSAANRMLTTFGAVKQQAK